MKVKDLIEQLKAYTPDTELIVAYWDKETIKDYAYDHETDELSKLTDEQWSEVVDTSEAGEWNWQSSASETLVEIAEEIAGFSV